MLSTILAVTLATAACATPFTGESSIDASTAQGPLATHDARVATVQLTTGDCSSDFGVSTDIGGSWTPDGRVPESGSALATDGVEAAPAQLLAIVADQLHLPDGATVKDGVLVVRDGVIVAAGEVDVPEGARVVRHDGHVTAGLVAPYSAGYLPSDESNENTRPFLPDGRVVYGFDPELPRLADALEQGVTTIVLPPAVSQVVGGRTGVVKTYGGHVVSRGAHLALSMGSQAANVTRAPTSYGGMVRALDGLFTEPQGAYAEVASGNLGLMTYVSERHEVDRALRLFARHGLKGALVGPSLAGELAERIAESGCSVVLPTPDLVPNERERDAMVALFEAKVAFGFWLNDPSRYRSSAITALRAGATRDDALNSITSTAAKIARVGTSVGQLARGFDADFVLWSGDPLEFTTTVEAVYVRGELAFGGDQ
ncbi:Imidazolonepropionase [Planctomycetes bacterium Pla163]|uniref:Imidazolonepropionase n=1 Tax=Rohdeia mirabilis TaxID=2528008 RepID=A0A518CUZ8_9BACT|nr:Imidazolonepropionase [Planctomycetes bacterium Pla163]